jgi:transcriptional regulator with GAF, ATPase, and Fis domain
MQVKLLRAIQKPAGSETGGEREVETDFRLICATNRDLTDLVKQGRFRDDLFYRINIVHLRIPALRDRHEDTLWLANRIVFEMSERLARTCEIHSPVDSSPTCHPPLAREREGIAQQTGTGVYRD